ncbi:MAG: ABC transporter ATP-binding protein [Propionibacteriaceae bacterium]|jgi:ABC-2 type transport system ATP-binding protein|nr:ABC transporter ATP-binding protein [Propionibacteriaceae bacterium]
MTAATAEPLVRLRDVRKSFGKAEVLHGIDLDVPAGRITGLLGPSGHGKTTLVNLVVGASRATSGSVTVLGETAPPRRVKPQIGYMPQADALYEDLTGDQNLRYFGALHGLNRTALNEAIPQALATVSLPAEPKKTVAQYSGGMRRRLSLAVALLHSPRLLVLDEPTVGLDPLHRVRLWEAFRDLAAQGRTLLITTHVMSEAAGCDTIVMLRSGRLIAQGPPAELTAQAKAADLEEAFLSFQRRAEGADDA